jgi:adenosylcobalamin-dependent ribonucleoside-triphosphate reductase
MSERFVLRPSFVSEWKTITPDFGPLGEIVYKRTYARSVGRGTEVWWQTIQRVVEGAYTILRDHTIRHRLPWSEQLAQANAEEMFRRMYTMRFLPSGRGLWMMGTSYLATHGSAALMNCAFVSTDSKSFARPFTFLMDFSMLGVGVGFDTRGVGRQIVAPSVGDDVHIVEDSREGWVGLVQRVLDAYAGIGTIPASIDFSQIRPAGTPIRGFGGVAAGPEPLERCVEMIHRILRPLVGRRLTSSAIVDLANVIGVCVVSGNVRRSAEIALGDPNDEVFLHLKDPDRYPEELRSHRWASNNSVVATIGMDYRRVAALSAKNGEPGYFWLETARRYGRLADPPSKNADPLVAGVNPCGEIALEPYETCNLVETFPSRHESFEDYLATLRYAHLYAKIVTLIPTHDEATNSVGMRNRRLGISQSGIVENIARRGLAEHLRWCDLGYQYLRQVDDDVSAQLAVPRSRKLTTVKPSGTISLLPGVTPGIHHEHAPYYYRTIRMATNSPIAAAMRRAGYRVETDLAAPDSLVVYVPVKARYFERAKDEVSMWEQLELAAQMQAYWADNAVSVTVTVAPDEARDIARALSLYERRLKSVSFLPLVDHGYEQAPYITITADEYERAASALRPLNLAGAAHEATDAYCDGEACTLPAIA